MEDMTSLNNGGGATLPDRQDKGFGGLRWKKILRYYDTKAVRSNCRHGKSDLQHVIRNCQRQDNTLNIGGSHPVILNLFQDLNKKYRDSSQVLRKNTFLVPYCLSNLVSSKKAAFTLAEVLITLAIIGIVAAMTIPTLIAKYQKKQILVQLKNSFSVVSNAIRLSEVDNGPMSIWPTGAEMDVNAYWTKYLKPYFANPVLCATKSDCGYDDDLDRKKWSCGSRWGILTDDTRLLFRLKNGTIVFLPRNSHAQDGTPIYASQLYIDVNGASSPNECGKDVFMFIRTDKGIMPYSSPGKDCNTNPEFCADTIMKNGWEYPEDYPY